MVGETRTPRENPRKYAKSQQLRNTAAAVCCCTYVSILTTGHLLCQKFSHWGFSHKTLLRVSLWFAQMLGLWLGPVMMFPLEKTIQHPSVPPTSQMLLTSFLVQNTEKLKSLGDQQTESDEYCRWKQQSTGGQMRELKGLYICISSINVCTDVCLSESLTAVSLTFHRILGQGSL